MSQFCYVAPSRHIILLLTLLAIALCFAHRVVLNLAITEMALPLPADVPCKMMFKVKEVGGQKLDWNQLVQSLILLSIYPAWTLLYIPVHFFCKKYGGRCPIIIGIMLSTFGTGLMPVAAKYLNWGIILIVRAMMGCGQAMVFAASTEICAKWVSLDDRINFNRTRFVSGIFGIIVGTLLTGVLLNLTYNWIYAYYFWCILGCIWLIFGFVLIYNEPTMCPYIPNTELDDVLKDRSSYQLRTLTTYTVYKDPASWALVCAQLGNNFVFYTIFTNMPKHLKEVIKLNSKETCLAATAPYFALILGYLMATQLSVKLIKKNINITLIFKACVFLGTVVPTLILAVLRVEICDKYFVGGVIAVALFFNGCCRFVIDEGCSIRTIYNYDFLYAVVCSFGSIPKSLTPLIIGRIAEHNTVHAWNWISNTMCIICSVFCLVFLIFGSGRRAKWDYSNNDLWNVPPPRNKKWYLQNAD